MKSKYKDNSLSCSLGSADIHNQQPSTIAYALSNEKWLTVSEELSHVQLTILYHIRTLDPLNERAPDLRATDIARATGLRKGVISKAIKILSDKGFLALAKPKATSIADTSEGEA